MTKRTTLWLLKDQVQKRPQQAALRTSTGDTITYGGLDEASLALARVLLARGIKPGDRVGLAFRNAQAIPYLISYFGVQRAGGVVMPVNPRSPRLEAERQFEHAEATLVLLGEGAEEGVVRAAGKRGLAWPLERTARTDLVPPEPEEADPAELLYTSGTTGTQKGVLVPHRNAVGLVSPAYEALLGGRTFLDPLPLHTYAGNAYLLFCIKAGLTNLYLEWFEPAAFMDRLKDRAVAATYAVAPMWLRILKELPDLDPEDYGHVISVSFGAAPMPVWGVKRLGALFPRSFIYNIYGLTEGGGAVCAFPPGEHLDRPDSVGKPVGATQVKILSASGAPCGPGERGEVLLRLAGVPNRSYYKDAQATDAVFAADGWVRTGDVGYLDADGYLYLVDRAKDIIIRGGNNISSVEVEEALLSHPGVAEAAAFGLPDEVLGEMVCAVIVPAPHRDPPSAAELRDYLKDRLAAYKLPARIDIAAALPRNAMGKVLKRQLREERAR